MSTDTSTRTPPAVESGKRRSRLLWTPVVVAVVVIAAIAGWLIRGEGGSQSTVDVETEEQIIKLLDDWFAAWNNSDGQAALDLFTEDGRFVNRESGPDGYSGEELKNYIDDEIRQEVQVGLSYHRSSDLLMIEQPDSYHVAFRVKAFEYGLEYLELHNIVDEDGTLKIRYVEGWSPLGWFRLSDDLPYEAKSGL